MYTRTHIHWRVKIVKIISFAWICNLLHNNVSDKSQIYRFKRTFFVSFAARFPFDRILKHADFFSLRFFLLLIFYISFLCYAYGIWHNVTRKTLELAMTKLRASGGGDGKDLGNMLLCEHAKCARKKVNHSLVQMNQSTTCLRITNVMHNKCVKMTSDRRKKINKEFCCSFDSVASASEIHLNVSQHNTHAFPHRVPHKRIHFNHFILFAWNGLRVDLEPNWSGFFLSFYSNYHPQSP